MFLMRKYYLSELLISSIEFHLNLKKHDFYEIESAIVGNNSYGIRKSHGRKSRISHDSETFGFAENFGR